MASVLAHAAQDCLQDRPTRFPSHSVACTRSYVETHPPAASLATPEPSASPRHGPSQPQRSRTPTHYTNFKTRAVRVCSDVPLAHTHAHVDRHHKTPSARHARALVSAAQAPREIASSTGNEIPVLIPGWKPSVQPTRPLGAVWLGADARRGGRPWTLAIYKAAMRKALRWFAKTEASPTETLCGEFACFTWIHTFA